MTSEIVKVAAGPLKAAAAFGLAMVLAGCSAGGFMGGGDGGSSQNLANAATSQAAISGGASSALPVIATECPPIRVRNGGEAIFSYADKKVGNPNALKFQAVIDKSSRNCVVSNGLITVKMGVVGRFLLGPVGETTSYDLPIRFAVERDGTAVFSQKYDLPVSANTAAGSQEFVKVVENVAIPYLGGEEIVIWVGFDPKT